MGNIRTIIALALFTCASTPAPGATTYYVAPSGDDSNPGSDTSPFATIQKGIDSALVDGDTVTVAAGTYVENIEFVGPNIVLRSTDPLDPDVVAKTIIDGSKAGSVVTFSKEEDESCVLSGFTITNGEAANGGGIYCQDSSPAIENNAITGNGATFGGGIYCEGASPKIHGNVITGNTAWGGGGIYCEQSSPTIENNTITANGWSSGAGGGIYLFWSTAMIANNTITGNSAHGGAGVYLRLSSGMIASNTITGNSAWQSDGGGGIYCYKSSPVIENNTIAGNSAESYGGGVSCERSSPTIENNTIAGNSASGTWCGGGGIWCYEFSSPTIANNSITGNSAELGGGGIYCYKSSSPIIANNSITGNSALASAGGGIYCYESSSPAIVNNTIAGNIAELDGGGIYSYESSPTIANTIIALNSSGIFNDTGSPTLNHNCVYNPGGYNYQGIADPTGTGGNISSDPLFRRNPYPGLDGLWSTPDDDYGDLRLLGSACIDKGDNSAVPAGVTTDLAGNPRITGAAVDMGAYESEPAFSEVASTESALVVELIAESGFLDDGVVSGDFSGDFNLTDFQIVTIKSGPFAGQGFFQGEWEATLDGAACSGRWEGVCFFKPSEKRVYLKGAVTGSGLSGVAEDYLAESTPGSGVYDEYRGTWKLGRLFAQSVCATLELSGTVVYEPPEDSTAEAYLLTVSFERVGPGGDEKLSTVVVTHVRIEDAGSAFDGEGFSTISYGSDSGSGQGWTHDKLVSPGVVEMKGMLASPIEGMAHGFLEGTAPPRTLRLAVEGTCLGGEPAARLQVTKWGPTRVSPGQVMTLLLEVRNDGTKAGENVVVVAKLPDTVEYVSCTGDGMYDPIAREVDWAVGAAPPGTRTILSVSVRVVWGLPDGTFIEPFVAAAIEVPEAAIDPSIGVSSEVVGVPSEDLLEMKISLTKGTDTQTLHGKLSITSAVGPADPIWSYEEDGEDVAIALEATIREEMTWKKVTWGIDGTKTGIEWIQTVEEALDIWEGVSQKVEFFDGLVQRDKIWVEDHKRLSGGAMGAGVVAFFYDFLEDIPTFGEDYADATRQLLDTIQGAIYDTQLQDAVISHAAATGQVPCGGPNPEVITAQDPNIKYGPAGGVSAGQKLEYRVEYENEGEGIAFGVYFTDALDEDLDDSTLAIGPVISVEDGSVIAPPGTYDSATRTITWLVGEVGPKEGGYADLSVNVRSDAPGGTEIINFATVYFRSVPEVTRTNGIVSIVPLDKGLITRLSRSGSRLILVWDSFGDGQYTVQTTSDLSSGLWEDAPGEWPAGPRRYELGVRGIQRVFIRVKAGTL